MSFPKLGSVTFCVEAAPTPALTHGQRLATLILDDEIATPTMLVFSHLPINENVMLELPPSHQFQLTILV